VASASRRKQILLEQRTAVRERIAELQSSLAVLDYKIENYEQIERDMAPLMSQFDQEESA
jgi:DNA-binding transcriptional MerR regulator